MKTFREFLKESVDEDCVELVSKIGSAIRQFKDLHWNVEGEQFLGVHELFGEIYEKLEEFQDRLAEKVRLMGLPVTSQGIEFGDVEYDIEGSIESAVEIIEGLRGDVVDLEMESDDPTVKNILGELTEAIDGFLYKLKSCQE